jgi:solute:Na+ symporter, SSS family
MLFRRIPARFAAAGFAAGILGMGAVILYTSLAWTWYTVTGAAITIITALLCTYISGLFNGAHAPLADD